MKLSKVRFKNYRCFDDFGIDFRSSINLLMGDNSAGKTTIIEGLRSVLGAFFSGLSDENTKWIKLSPSDFQITISPTSNELLMDRPITIEFTFSDVDYGERVPSMFTEEYGTELTDQLQYTSKKSDNRIPATLKKYSKEVYNKVDTTSERGGLPLFAYFSTEDIHKNRKSTTTAVDKFKQYKHKPSFGYYECLNGGYLLKHWTQRLLVLKEEAKVSIEVDGVIQAINDALNSETCSIITDTDIRVNKKGVYYTLSDGRKIDTDHLSDGYTRILNIVIDIAFRALLLNKSIYGKDAPRKTSGVVLIDEIDLHLHPQMQSVILQSLNEAFPSIQFIVSSHAPLIASGIDNRANSGVLKLEYSEQEGYTYSEISTFGVDVSTILETYLNAPKRSRKSEVDLLPLFNLIDDEKYTEATQLLNNLRQAYPDLREFASAQTMLDFFEISHTSDETNS